MAIIQTGRQLLVATLLLAGSLITAPAVQAATLQISPVTIALRATENAAGITLSNPGDQAIHGQVRVFKWEQANGEDVLSPTQELVASPPLIEIPAQGEHLIRLVKTMQEPGNAERYYRVLIDEIPRSDDWAGSGVMIRMRYSVPVFVQPPGAPGSPALTWHLARQGTEWTLRVNNTGTGYGQISAVQLVDRTGRQHSVNRGLLGYALAGSAREWKMQLPQGANWDQGVTIRANVNAIPVEAQVHPDSDT
jgi:fimbrial chaperone protein